jgi:RimJ/RimL family protein N-acetyltransferase
MSSDNPDYWTKQVMLKDGTSLQIRPEKPSDLPLLKRMFLTLSDESTKHLDIPFSEERIENLVQNLDYKKALPIVAIISEKKQERIISVGSLNFYSVEAYKHKTEFAITVHDDYQNMGIGTIMTEHMIDIARRMGLKKVFLRVGTDNMRAIHLYKKFGFRIEGELKMEYLNHITKRYGDDYQMALFL